MWEAAQDWRIAVLFRSDWSSADGRSRRPQRCWSPVRSSSARRIGYALLAFPPPDVDLMRKSALEVIHTIRLTFAGTLLVVGFSVVAPLPGQAVELVDPHAVLEQTRRDLIQLDRRMERYRAERQKEEARQKREAAEQARSDKALEEVRRKREIAEQEKRVREEKEREAQRRTQEAADREKSEAALRETRTAARRRRGAEASARRGGAGGSTETGNRRAGEGGKGGEGDAGSSTETRGGR